MHRWKRAAALLAAVVTAGAGLAVTAPAAWADGGAPWPDADGDGWTAAVDCADDDRAVHPGQVEFPGNGWDDDCDGGSADAPPGKLYGWGRNSNGTAGTGHAGPDVRTPAVTVVPDGVVRAELGSNAGFALLADGRLLSWGGNNAGVLGSGTFDGPYRETPAPVVGLDGTGELSDVRRIAAHDFAAAAVRADGTVVTWGFNANGQLGDGTSGAPRNRPGLVLTAPGTPLTGVRDVEAAYGAAYALMADGTVTAWGAVRCLGAPSAPRPFAAPIAGLDNIRQIAGSGSVMLFLRKDGTVLSCGSSSAELGREYHTNGPTSEHRPNPVTGLGSGGAVVDIAGSGSTAAALQEDGSVYMWGRNLNGELTPIVPPGSSTRVPMPVPLPAGAPVIGLDHDSSANVLLTRADGSMLAWGANANGSAGTGTAGGVAAPTPIEVPGRVVRQAVTSSVNGLALTLPVAG
ncbi:MopE-related protein [Dactylosporangium sp. CA-092794]|uniref:RCC1 domain-containing protein n=1 Tax=Dactylosporangium sp. CA-092794 TaxID=3239929 RepID=UPI003D8DEA08